MSEIRVNSLGNESNTGGPVLSGITTFSGQQYFVPPRGTTMERPAGCPAGSIRFNTDTLHLEYYDGQTWFDFEASSNEFGLHQTATTFAFGDSGGVATRGVFSALGGYPAISNVQNYVSIDSTGNAVDFGDLTFATRYGNAIGSSTRGIVYEAISPSTNYDTDIQHFVFSTTGSTLDFGANSNVGVYGGIATSNQTRGIRGGGHTPSGNSNHIDYITIASTGVAAKDFGDLVESFRYGNSCFSNCTRGVTTGGFPGTPSPAAATVTNHIGYITFSTEGNANNFGDLDVAKQGGSQGGSNSTRGIFAGGNNGSTITNELEFITIASTGNGRDFGDLSTTTQYGAAASSKTRLVVAMGNYPSYVDTIDYVNINTTGNSFDFGNLDVTGGDSGTHCGASNGHGGL